MRCKEMVLFPLCCLFLFSCSSLHRYRIEGVTAGQRPFPAGTGVSILIDGIEVNYSDMARSMEYPIEKILVAIGTKHGLIMADTEKKEPDLLLSLWIREDRFIRNISEETSITAVCTIRDAVTGKEYANLMYTENSAETIENFYHLYSILDICMKRTADVLKKDLTAKE